MRILPYKLGSKSGKALAQALNVKRVRREKGKFTNRYNHVILNWGSGSLPHFHRPGTQYINHPDKVNRAGNKLLAFKDMKDKARIPEFTEDKEVAHAWLSDGITVVARTILRGHSGNGIHILDGDVQVPDAPLYVKYVKKADEYRVHVFRNKVIDVQMKKKRHEIDKEDVDFKVRNLAGGWVFCREGVEAPADVIAQAKAAVEALQLDFGAVDVGFNRYHDEAYVFEVNTACGLEGSTVDSYAKAIKEWYHA